MPLPNLARRREIHHRSIEVKAYARDDDLFGIALKSTLRGAASCMHLMEMLLPMATTAFQGVNGLQRENNATPFDAKAMAGRMDSCYAYSRERSVVKVHWPELHQAPQTEPSR